MHRRPARPLNLRNPCCANVLRPPPVGTTHDEVPLKVGANSHFDAALILINGLVAIGLHNGGPFGMARRL